MSLLSSPLPKRRTLPSAFVAVQCRLGDKRCGLVFSQSRPLKISAMPDDVPAPSRVFPPPYVSSGDACEDRLAFFHILERLKTQKRTGWVDHKVPGPESISDHMYRMAVLAMCSSDTNLDIAKCVMMAVVHDLAEAQIGDIAPREGIPKAEKRRLEAEAIHNFVHEMLHDSPAAKRIESLWKEYEEGESKEAKFVKDLDRFEVACQGTLSAQVGTAGYVTDTFLGTASEYERNHGMQTLQPFFDSSLPFIRHPEVQQWGEALSDERKRAHTQRASAAGAAATT
ncbi:HD domain-containing protein [Trametes elegans]|nr:HD domain-containing protein [Trametes elegans]